MSVWRVPERDVLLRDYQERNLGVAKTPGERLLGAGFTADEAALTDLAVAARSVEHASWLLSGKPAYPVDVPDGRIRRA